MRTANQYNISINQLADFSKGTESKKRGIIKQQKRPNPFKVSWYQLAKSRIKKSITENGNIDPILDGIEELKARPVTKGRQASDRTVSIEAMQKFMELRISNFLKDLDYKILPKKKINSIFIKDVEVIISPDLIIHAKIDKKEYLGAVKIHIAKHNQFDSKQQSYVATGIYRYLQTVKTSKNDIVLPSLCISIDIFSGKMVSAPDNIENKIKDIENICEEVKSMWFAA